VVADDPDERSQQWARGLRRRPVPRFRQRRRRAPEREPGRGARREPEGGKRVVPLPAASDDFEVREVLFFRVDAAGDAFLGRDASAPYTFETTLPAAPGTTVRYFARAVDDAGQEADSREVVVSVR
jgi:hypothetical protein